MNRKIARTDGFLVKFLSMGVKGSNEWKKLNREMKILQAKAKASVLTPKEKQRLGYLEERFGEAKSVTRIRLREEIDGDGPKTLTSDDHWATEVSEELIQDAEEYTPQKAWEKDIEVKRAKFEATDSRKGKQTFRQKGLSQFAVDLSDDFQEEGFEEIPQEEQEGAEKQAQWGRVNYAKEENFQEAGRTAQGSNPFAVDMDPSLAGALGDFADSQQSVVPDVAAKGFEVEQDEDDMQEGFGDFTARVDDSEEVQALFQEGEENTSVSDEQALSFGEMTTHQAEGDEDAQVDYDLVKSAIEYAEDKGLTEDAAEIWAVDDQGQEIEYTSEESLVEPGVPTAFGRPPPDEAPAPSAPDDLAVLVPDTQEDDLEYEQPTSVADPPVGLDRALDQDDESTKIENPLDPSDDNAEAEIEISQDSIPDLSEGSQSGYEVDLWVSPEDDDLPPPPDDDSAPQKGYKPPPPPDDDAGWMPEPSPMATSNSDPLELDLSNPEEDHSPPSADNIPSAVDDMDSFWGLVEETHMADQQIPTISEEPMDFQTANESGPESEPLPALDLNAAIVPPSSDHQVKTAAPAKGNDHGLDRAEALLSNLFGESPEDKDMPQASPEPLEPIVVGSAPAKKPSTPQKPHVGRGVSRIKASKPNDLRGPRRATVHFKDGVSKRGVISEVDTDANTIVLDPPKGGNRPKEKLNAMALKAIFLLLPRGVAYPEKSGYYCKIVLMDNRKLEGYTPDYDPQRKAFTLFPLEDKGNIERILIFNEAIKNLWFPEE